MPILTIRGVSDELHGALARVAARNRRSVQAQVLLLLEAAHRLDTPSPLAEAESIRARFAGRDLGDTVSEIRADRSR